MPRYWKNKNSFVFCFFALISPITIAITSASCATREVPVIDLSTLSDGDLTSINDITFESKTPDQVNQTDINTLYQNEFLISGIMAAIRKVSIYPTENDFTLSFNFSDDNRDFSNGAPLGIKIIALPTSKTLKGEKAFSTQVKSIQWKAYVNESTFLNFNPAPFQFVPVDPYNVTDAELSNAVKQRVVTDSICDFLNQKFIDDIPTIDIKIDTDYSIIGAFSLSDDDFVVNPAIGKEVRVGIKVSSLSNFIRSNDTFYITINFFAIPNAFDLCSIPTPKTLVKNIVVEDISKITFSEWDTWFNANKATFINSALSVISTYIDWIDETFLDVVNNEFISGEKIDGSLINLEIRAATGHETQLVNYFYLQVQLNTMGEKVNIFDINTWWDGWNCEDLPTMKQQLDDKIDLSQVPYETVVEIFNSKLSGIIPNALNLLQLSKYTTSDKKISIPLQTDDFRIEFADVGTSFDFETNPTQKIRFSIAMQQSSDRSAKQEVVGAIGGYPIDDPQHSLYINMNLYKGDLSKKWETHIGWYANSETDSSGKITPISLKFNGINWWGRGHDGSHIHDDYHTKENAEDTSLKADVYAYNADLTYDATNLTREKLAAYGLTENTTYYYDTVDSFANANFMSYMDNEINADLSVGPSNYVDPNTGATYPARVYDFNLDRGSNSTMISWNGWTHVGSGDFRDDHWTKRTLQWSRNNAQPGRPAMHRWDPPFFTHFNDPSTPGGPYDLAEYFWGGSKTDALHWASTLDAMGYTGRPAEIFPAYNTYHESAFGGYWRVGNYTGRSYNSDKLFRNVDDDDVDERILKGTKSYVADSTKTRQDNLAASVVTLDKNFFDSSEWQYVDNAWRDLRHVKKIVANGNHNMYDDGSFLTTMSKDTWMYQNELSVYNFGVFAVGTWWGWGWGNLGDWGPWKRWSKGFKLNSGWENEKYSDDNYSGATNIIFVADPKYDETQNIGFYNACTNLFSLIQQVSVPWRLTTNVMKNVGITIIPRDTLTAKNPGIYLSIDRGDKDQNRIPKFEFKMPWLIDFSNYGFSCAGENNIFQVNDTDGQKSPGSPPPKCGVLSPGYWKTWQNVLSTNLKTMGSTYAYSMYTPY